MQKKKKEFVLKRLTPYMGSKRILLPLSLVLSGISAVLNIVPFVLVWYIIRDILSESQAINVSHISFYAWLAFASALMGIVVYFCALTSSHLAAFRVEVGMQKIGMKKILDMPLGFFDKHSSGKIRKIVNDGAGTTHSFLAHQLPDMAGSVISPMTLIVLILVVDWRMGLASLVPIILGFITMKFMTSSKGKKFQQMYYDSLEEMSSESVEYIRGIPVVKTFGQSIFSFKKFYDSILRYKEMVLAYTFLWRKPMSFFTVIMQSAAFFLIPMAILLIGRGEILPLVLSDFIFYLLISPLFATLLMKSMFFQQNVLIAEQAIDRLDNLLNYPGMHYIENTKNIKNHSLEFRDVVFSYEGSNKRAINKISFKLNEGETVALVGASGGGKTTIARLAARFWDIDEGEVLVGGINVRDISKKELMNNVSFVFQSTKLFKGSLRENVVFGKEDIGEKEINQAIDSSQSREIIENLQDGLDTVMGTKGTYLSGGEQQRIALARAMVKNAPIVLLDEATAFADPENEHLIQKALKTLSHGKTTLMIAHRLTTVQDADRILVIENGKIEEEGTHIELIEQGGLYKTMWDEYQKTIAWKIAARETACIGVQNA
ncbi:MULTISPECIES: ABC transporter ATP-binding protein [unclassified Oceanispirochaeta]|uniref:ABC transporter ATP-binding protein n=1 Tax=unclassified Oceanispirochaeta TaxID=2635722 RepID=UPI000E0926F2|nr:MULTISPECIES: ABC transporter ATP-binding protein [unclassified Oceanispirochaeta]MBF9016514.1 ABC transporter ATP-binding protein [Oceanispirochaeta sp. M2]NPD72976.1 ABC transporter ATP-binding protein [Oceanispirochaeta sp. M1]RDG31320.1 ABC transporter ATP-binding protein [Oceanispirochaeta sp. M1]